MSTCDPNTCPGHSTGDGVTTGGRVTHMRDPYAGPRPFQSGPVICLCGHVDGEHNAIRSSTGAPTFCLLCNCANFSVSMARPKTRTYEETRESIARWLHAHTPGRQFELDWTRQLTLDQQDGWRKQADQVLALVHPRGWAAW